MSKLKNHHGVARKKFIFKVGIAIGILITMVFAFYLSKFRYGFSDKQDVWGQFGDYFGGVLNPILSFCAFIALLVTLIDQKEAASDSDARHRTEVADVRFFQMLALLPQSISEVKYCEVKHEDSKYDVFLESRAATEKMWNSLRLRMNSRFSIHDSLEKKYKDIREAVHSFNVEVWPLTGFYFQLINAVIEFVSKSGEPGEAGFDLYMSLLKSQLTEHERLLVFYISLGSEQYLKHAQVVFSAGFCDSALTVDPLSSLREELLEQAIVNSQVDKKLS